MSNSSYKLVVYVPLSHADAVRDAMAQAGAGRIGAYSHCSFSVRGIGRFKGDATTQPFLGTAGVLEAVEEERIELTVAGVDINAVIAAMKAAHPYEEIAYDVYARQPL